MVSWGSHGEPTMPCPARSLLRGADELGLRKAVKAEFGGGTRSFSCEEDFIYENVESELRFFTSQVTALRPCLCAYSPRIYLTPVSPTGAAEHHSLLVAEPSSQAGGGSAQRALLGGPANQ